MDSLQTKQKTQDENVPATGGGELVPAIGGEEGMPATGGAGVRPEMGGGSRIATEMVAARQPQVVLTRVDLGESAMSRRNSLSSVGRFWASGRESDGDSFVSMGSVESLGRSQYKKDDRKRPRDSRGSKASSSEDEQKPKAKVVASRGRGRPATTGEYVGLAEAKAALNQAKQEELRLRAEEEVAGMAQAVQTRAREFLSVDSLVSDGKEAGEILVSDLKGTVADSLKIISQVARKSGNLKGGFIRALKEAASAIASAVDILAKRTASEETARLERSNARLQAELHDLRQEFVALRARMESSRADLRPTPSEAQVPANPPPQHPAGADEFARTIMVQVGTMINARFEALEDRLLPERRIRPSLAADKGQRKTAAKPTETEARVTTLVAPANPAPIGKKGKKKARKKKAQRKPEPQPTAPTPTAGPAQVASAPSTADGWNVVVRRGAKKSTPAKQQQTKPDVPLKKRKAGKLRPPRSAAVVIKLQPSAVERNITYKEVFAQVKTKIDLSDLGIKDVRFKVASTGARMLEIPGANSGEKADVLAQALKGALGGEDVKISRPTKCAELRVTGLDDSVTPVELAEAIGRAGGCNADLVKSGEIRRDKFGLGSAWVRCPVVAAKKVVDGGRLLVGLVSAQVKLLQARPQRCYRCHEGGHVAARCTGAIDRSAQCYRCGQSGHSRSQCTSAPHCAVCEAAKRPADHTVGSAACARSQLRNRGRRATPGPAAQEQPVHNKNEEGRAMES